MMECQEIRELLMGYLDGELDDEARRGVESHLTACPACRLEERSFRRLTEMTESIEFVEPTESEWRAHWQHIYNRLERGLAWILLSLGALVLLLYGAWRFVGDFLLNGEFSPVLRVGVGVVVAGAAVLLISVVRERIRLYQVDRYEEVEL